MKLEKFIEKLDKGEIKDLKPYIEKENIDILLEIAKRGLEVDYLLKRGELEVIETLINNGYASEYYDFWKHHSKQSIRETLAKNGFFRDEFIKDKKYPVRLAAAGMDPEYLIKLANRTKTNTEHNEIAYRFRQMPNLTIDQIDFILQNAYSRYYEDAFRLKREGTLKEPTVFEKTLTTSQLFALNNPLWVNCLSVDIIHKILMCYNDAKQDGWVDQFGDLLDRFTANNYEDIYGIQNNYIKEKGIKHMATLRKIKDASTSNTYTITVERGVDVMKTINTYQTTSPETDIIVQLLIYAHKNDWSISQWTPNKSSCLS